MPDDLNTVEDQMGGHRYPKRSGPDQKIAQQGAQQQTGNEPGELQVKGAEDQSCQPNGHFRPAKSLFDLALQHSPEQ